MISLGLRDESENTLHISLLENRALSSEAFSCRTGARGLDNVLNCGPRKACNLPDLARRYWAFIKSYRRTDSHQNRST